MTAIAEIAPPHVRFFTEKSQSFLQFGSEWKRCSPEDEGRLNTGYDRQTREACVGVYIARRPNGLVRVGFDLWRLNVNLSRAAIERIEKRWRQDAASLSKSMLHSVGRRAHFSKSFMRFEISPERLEEWKLELEHVLSNPAAFERLEYRTGENG